MGRDLFFELPDESLSREPGDQWRCTPERLLEFLRECQRLHGRFPTLGECKQRFGGVLGPFVDYWELERRGLIKNGRLVENDHGAK